MNTYYSDFFKKTKKIDILDLNYSLSKEEINYIDTISTSRKRFSGVFWGLTRFVATTIKLFFGRIKIKKKDKFNIKEVVFFAGSLNQFESLKPIYENCNYSSLIGTRGYGEYRLNVFLSHLYSILFIPFFFVRYQNSNGYSKDSMNFLFDRYLHTYGFYFYSLLFFNRFNNIKVLILANDHTMVCRVINKVARDFGIKTIFIQHAGTNKHFPPLSFDFAFLDGVDASEIYSSIGKSNTKIFITGNARLDLNLKKYKQKENTLIGLCFNPNDDKEIVLHILNLLITKFGNDKIIVRPHPNDRKYKYFRRVCQEKNVRFSPAKYQSVYEFFQHVKIIVAGESNIHLEASAFNVHSIYFELGIYKKKDWYGFISKGIIKWCPTNESELISIILNLSLNNSKVNTKVGRFYKNAQPEYTGSSITQILNLIERIKSNSNY